MNVKNAILAYQSTGNTTNSAAAPSRAVFITETALRKLLASYAHVSNDDDEYTVPAFTIAETAIFVDAERLTHQRRGRFNVVTDGAAAKEVLERMQTRYGGKIRMSVTHCHQFGMPTLSSTDVAGFQRVLGDPLASKPFTDGKRIPVLLINGSGDAREVLAFWVTAEGFFRADLRVLFDGHAALNRAWQRAPIALPTLPRDETLGEIRSALGPGYSVVLGRGKKDGQIALLVQTPLGDKIVARFPEWPYGFPVVTVNGRFVGGKLNILRFVSLNRLCAVAVSKFPEAASGALTLTVTMSEGTATQTKLCVNTNDVTGSLEFIDAVNWTHLIKEIVAVAHQEVPPLRQRNIETTRDPHQEAPLLSSAGSQDGPCALPVNASGKNETQQEQE